MADPRPTLSEFRAALALVGWGLSPRNRYDNLCYLYPQSVASVNKQAVAEVCEVYLGQDMLEVVRASTYPRIPWEVFMHSLDVTK